MKKKKRKKIEQTANKPSIKGNIIGLLACVPFLLFGVAMICVSINEVSYTNSCTAETKGTVDNVSVERETARMSSNGNSLIVVKL